MVVLLCLRAVQHPCWLGPASVSQNSTQTPEIVQIVHARALRPHLLLIPHESILVVLVHSRQTEMLGLVLVVGIRTLGEDEGLALAVLANVAYDI